MDQKSGVLAGKVALVTGGSRGLGRAIVETYAAHGAAVIVASRKLDACRAVADEVAEAHGVETFPVEVNVSRWESCDELVATSYERFGVIDVLVNNAGASPAYPSLDEVSEGLFDKVIALNLRGPFRLMSLVGSRMASGRGGSIINISSIEVTHPAPAALPYAAAKAGLEAFSAGFMRALGPTVRVNTIRCGLFRTDIAKAWGTPEEVDAMAAQQIVLERIGDATEVAGAALFLASDASSYCTGATLAVDGGVK
jgi:NAD(P)-dependent dehydrogenase (short-subunit alcohol dehydrogenase family)